MVRIDNILEILPPEKREELRSGLLNVQVKEHDSILDSMAKVRRNAADRNDIDMAALESYESMWLKKEYEKAQRADELTKQGKGGAISGEWSKIDARYNNQWLPQAKKYFGVAGGQAWNEYQNTKRPTGMFKSAVNNVYDDSDGGVQWGGVAGALGGALIALIGGEMLGFGGGWGGIIALVGGALLGSWLGNKGGDLISNFMHRNDVPRTFERGPMPSLSQSQEPQISGIGQGKAFGEVTVGISTPAASTTSVTAVGDLVKNDAGGYDLQLRPIDAMPGLTPERLKIANVAGADGRIYEDTFKKASDWLSSVKQVATGQQAVNTTTEASNTPPVPTTSTPTPNTSTPVNASAEGASQPTNPSDEKRPVASSTSDPPPSPKPVTSKSMEFSDEAIEYRPKDVVLRNKHTGNRERDNTEVTYMLRNENDATKEHHHNYLMKGRRNEYGEVKWHEIVPINGDNEAGTPFTIRASEHPDTRIKDVSPEGGIYRRPLEAVMDDAKLQKLLERIGAKNPEKTPELESASAMLKPRDIPGIDTLVAASGVASAPISGLTDSSRAEFNKSRDMTAIPGGGSTPGKGNDFTT